MAITGREFELEERRLVEVSKLLDDQLAKMGEKIFEDEEKAKELSENAHRNASELVNKQTNAQRMVDIFTTISKN